MAKKREVIVIVIIAVFFMAAIGFMGMMFVGVFSQQGEFNLTGLGGNVGVVEVNGVIDEPSGRKVIKLLDKWTDNNSIKAVIIHINSPGGGVAISQEIYNAINRTSEQKPVVASMASVAASGGYYIACGADRIVANPGTITGSIGVIFEFYNLQGLMQKVGVSMETVKSGELKDVGSFARKMTKKEELMLRSVVMDTYEQFVEVVAKGRGKNVEDIYPLADGSIYTGLQAYNLGLVDTIGDFNEAVNIAANLAHIEGKPKIVRQSERKKISIFDLIGNISKISKVFNQNIEYPFTKPQLLYLYQ